MTGDIAFLVIETCGGEPASLTTPNGFVQVANSPQATGSGTNGTQLTVYWCRATSNSMAAPVVAGIAALIREYYPKLKAAQVKEILMKSVVKVEHDVNLPGDKTGTKVPFSSLCKSGGIVNVYNALVLAASYANGRAAK